MSLAQEWVTEGLDDAAAKMELEAERRRNARIDTREAAIARFKAAADDLDSERAIDGAPLVDRAARMATLIARMRLIAIRRAYTGASYD